ncbi:MAG: glycosyl transferase family 4 [Thermosphaera sp.]
MITDYLEILIPSLMSGLSTFFLVKWWIPKALRLGFKGKDMNKYDRPEVSEAGGIWVVLSTSIGILGYIMIESVLDRDAGIIQYLSMTQVLLLSGMLGFIDDLLGWKKGISPLARVLFTFPIALPLMAVKAGFSTIEIPVIGVADLGLIYPLLIVPLGIVGASNAFNMIAGYNGLETLQGITLLSFTCLFLLKKGSYQLIPVVIPVLASLAAFYYFNKYPAKVLPGNSLTYGIGAFYASLVIYGNFERFGLFLFIPYFGELLLFLRGLKNNVYKENFGIPDEHNHLQPPYPKSYSITHLAIKILIKIRGHASEKGVVYTILLVQVIVGTLGLCVF